MALRNHVNGYRHDVFVSYSHAVASRDWVLNHFGPLLERWLDQSMPRKADVFIDKTGIRAGGKWPDEIKYALHRSRVLVAIWCPPYFASNWCMAEWKSMCLREKALRIAPGRGEPLVWPIRFADGDFFPDDAKKTQHVDMAKWAWSEEAFRRTEGYHEFERAVRDFAERLGARLQRAPAWDAKWPVARPAARKPPVAPLPLMGG